ncbi:VanZ family protein [Hyphomonas pacifica]|uniref:VanZ family protein n=1 Tax=Hyphomonas pacifica TaxID=1280941 RepID=UPI000DC03826|nr:VanZ family protein [Hyphomonas pacifica]RAN33767.1 hypothetical protein HY11_03480 [Hyphomonas pacifica]
MRALLSHKLTRALAVIATIILIIVIAHLSLSPAADVPAPQVSDKVKHFAAYFVLAGTLATAFGPKRGIYALIVAILYGLAMEVAQDMGDAGREGSIADALANTAGAACGVLAAKLLRRN